MKGMKKFQEPLTGGFTLVELLIVIVIIGILAGVLIGVMDPVQQQNRARDGAIRAALNKAVLSTKSLLVSSTRTTNDVPTPAEFINGIGNRGTNTCTVIDPTVTRSCTFTATGISLPTDCSSAYGGSAGGAACSFVYYRTPTSFRIGARGFARPVALFVYDYVETAGGVTTEGFYSCADAFNIASGAVSACTAMN